MAPGSVEVGERLAGYSFLRGFACTLQFLNAIARDDEAFCA
jgi:hypothetical protein